MKNTHNLLTWLTLFLAICMITKNHLSNAEENDKQIHHFQNRTQETLKLSTMVAGFLCFLAASVSSAGGIGGGGLYIPILTLVSGFELKTATSFSSFMVTGGSIANVIYNLIILPNCGAGGKIFINFDIALLSEPCMLLGVSMGVICNLVFPEWLVTVLFSVFLAWSTFKTCKNGVLCWKLESEKENRYGCAVMENGLVRDGGFDETEEVKCIKEPLLNVEEEDEGDKRLKFPWLKLGVLVVIWSSFSALYLLRGNRYGQGITKMEPCGVEYWILSSLQIPLAIVFTGSILYKKESSIPNQEVHNDTLTSDDGPSNKLVFPLMALLAGVLGGLFGIGGGMLISPLLLHVGILPEVTAATCSFMVFFSSTMSALQYLLLGMEDTDTALLFAIICFVGSFVGLVVVQRAIREFGRASLIVFSVSIVMALSTILISSFGALDVWKNYMSGNYMWFKLPC